MAKKKAKQTRGKGAGQTKPAPSETAFSGHPQLPQTSPAVTSYGIFDLCVQRAKNLIKLHTAAHGRQAKPEKYMADAHRAAIVLAVAALDAFVRSFIIARTRTLLARRDQTLPAALRDHIKKFLKDDDLLDAARKDDLLDRVEKAFTSDFERRSFQGTKNIGDFIKMVGFDNIFHDVAVKAKVNEETLCSNLDRFTKRRHLIAHRGDYDLTENPPVQNVVTKKDAEDCIRTVVLIAKHINALGDAS